MSKKILSGWKHTWERLDVLYDCASANPVTHEAFRTIAMTVLPEVLNDLEGVYRDITGTQEPEREPVSAILDRSLTEYIETYGIPAGEPLAAIRARMLEKIDQWAIQNPDLTFVRGIFPQAKEELEAESPAPIALAQSAQVNA